MAMSRTGSDVNIILGGLLFLSSGLAELYMLTFYEPPAACATQTSMLFGNVCISMWYVLLVPIVLGLGMVIFGASMRPVVATAQDLLRTDPFTTLVLAFAGIMTLLAGVMFAVFGINRWVNNDPPTAWAFSDSVLAGLDLYISLTIAFGTIFLVGLGINLAHVRRRRRFLRSYNRALARHRGR